MQIATPYEIQELIDSGAISLITPRPLLQRCDCGRVISGNKRYCLGCMTVELDKLQEAK